MKLRGKLLGAAIACCLVIGGSGVAFGREADLAKRLAAMEKEVAAMKQALAAAQDTVAIAAPGDMRTFWKGGLRFETANPEAAKKAGKSVVTFKIGGRAHNDWAWFGEDEDIEDAFGRVENGTEFRNARIHLLGTINDCFEFMVQYGFEGGDADFKHVFIGFKKVPVVGNVRIGHQFVPFSMVSLMSGNDDFFMEGALTVMFAPYRETGITVFNTACDERMTWAVGAFHDVDSYGDGMGNDVLFAARVTALPMYENDGKSLVHVGLSYMHRDVKDSVRYRVRPEMHMMPFFLDTGMIAATDVDTIGLEFAALCGPFSLQSEYVCSEVNADGDNMPKLDAFFVQASYVLTGEGRGYSKPAGRITGVTPAKSLGGKDDGIGAWEVALRYSVANLDDDMTDAGKLEDVTIGLNWYINPHARIMLNYVLADLEHVGNARGLMMRFQVNF